MVDTSTERTRRSRKHRQGDHSLCLPVRCAAARLAQPAAGSLRLPPGPAQEPARNVGGDAPRPIRDACLEALTKAGVPDTWLARLALDCAVTLDSSTAVVGRAPLVKELSDTMQKALAEGKLLTAGDDPLAKVHHAARQAMKAARERAAAN